MNLQASHYRIIIFLIGGALFLPFLGAAPLFDWDEINFAESAREMLVTGNYSRVQINFQPFWEKPPLFFWMQVLSMKAFGINEYAARFPNAVFGILTLLTLFEMGRNLRSERFGFLWALCMAGSFLPLVYFKSGIIDPVFNYFIFTSIWFISRAVRHYGTKTATRQSLYAGLCIGLAILTKGPVGLVLACLTFGVFWTFKRFKPVVSIKNLLLFTFSALFVTLAWFGPETYQHGTWFFNEFITYQIRLFSTPDAGHAQPIYYHFVVVLLGCFPMSALALKGLFRRPQFRVDDPDFLLWMKILFWVVLILFSIVTTKIVHYSSMTYLPLSAIAAMSMEEYLRGRQAWKFWQVIGVFFIGFPIGLVMLAIPYVGLNIQQLVPLMKDPFAVQNLQADVHWSMLDLLPGMIWIVGTLIGAYWLWKGTNRTAIVSFFTGTVLATAIFLMTFPKRIAGYTQQAAVEFYQGIQGKDVYVETLHFKSFAQYFYSRKQSFSALETANCKDATGYYHIDALREWYLHGAIDKPVYFVVKCVHAQEYLNMPGIEKVGEKNGFVFLLRKPN
jgi:4-amino-4-deoxy-L-arabinose transferase-like glycosyltransferase